MGSRRPTNRLRWLSIVSVDQFVNRLTVRFQKMRVTSMPKAKVAVATTTCSDRHCTGLHRELTGNRSGAATGRRRYRPGHLRHQTAENTRGRRLLHTLHHHHETGRLTVLDGMPVRAAVVGNAVTGGLGWGRPTTGAEVGADVGLVRVRIRVA